MSLLTADSAVIILAPYLHMITDDNEHAHERQGSEHLSKPF